MKSSPFTTSEPRDEVGRAQETLRSQVAQKDMSVVERNMATLSKSPKQVYGKSRLYVPLRSHSTWHVGWQGYMAGNRHRVCLPNPMTTRFENHFETSGLVNPRDDT